jgi:polyhydroxybutyrate depolymerase
MRFRRAVLILAAIPLALAGCARPPAEPPTSTSGSSVSSSATLPSASATKAIDLYAGTQAAVAPDGSVVERTLTTADGRTRHYRLFVPAGISGTAPLLVALHGALASGVQFENTTGFDGLATSNGFLVAYPDGIGSGADGSVDRTWNAQGCCGPARAAGVDDVAFLRALVADVEAAHGVDRSRVFLAGHSNGAMMSLRLACEAADIFAAAGVQSGALVSSPCKPAKPVSLLQIHGTDDNVVPIDGGSGVLGGSTVYPPAREASQTIASSDACAAVPSTVDDATNPGVAVTTWSGCTAATGVEFVAVADAAHPWMHAAPESLPAGTPYPGIDSSRAIWAFLAAHPRA